MSARTRPCAWPPCPNLVTMPGGRGRPPEYCSARCRRRVENAQKRGARRRPDGLLWSLAPSQPPTLGIPSAGGDWLAEIGLWARIEWRLRQQDPALPGWVREQDGAIPEIAEPAAEVPAVRWHRDHETDETWPIDVGWPFGLTPVAFDRRGAEITSWWRQVLRAECHKARCSCGGRLWFAPGDIARPCGPLAGMAEKIIRVEVLDMSAVTDRDIVRRQRAAAVNGYVTGSVDLATMRAVVQATQWAYDPEALPVAEAA
jgi:hypothetical protein